MEQLVPVGGVLREVARVLPRMLVFFFLIAGIFTKALTSEKRGRFEKPGIFEFSLIVHDVYIRHKRVTTALGQAATGVVVIGADGRPHKYNKNLNQNKITHSQAPIAKKRQKGAGDFAAMVADPAAETQKNNARLVEQPRVKREN